MKLNLSGMLFLSTMTMSILMSISSSNWIMIWCGLEISLISFIPLMLSKKKMTSESTMKYFITQSISSTMLMLGMMIMIMKGDYNYEYMLMSSLLIKMGVPPFHSWVPTVVEGLSIMPMMILLTINKIAPLTIMSFLKMKLSLIIFITMIVGSIMSLNQNSIKKMIGYSSIFNMSFILSIIKSNLMWTLYLVFYFLLMFMLSLILKMTNNNFINQMVFSDSMVNKMTLWTTLLSLGGMPPMIGFYTKYMVMTLMIEMKFLTLIFMMVMTSLVVMFFYLRMTFMSIMLFSIKGKIKLFNLNNMSLWMMTTNLLLLPIMFMAKNI
uniref:NADH-ubiquinone oxidoreductase chain 2 n=1 Tax=Typhlocyba choui TaxID=2893151 RepID=A0A9E6XQ80_9HEMI|nr:NADH dehydrogenase subunit 2 [Typhlocyba choui]UGN61394.1 NADH dehydrogenase subunit 2 [Typhlocyba choui]